MHLDSAMRREAPAGGVDQANGNPSQLALCCIGPGVVSSVPADAAQAVVDRAEFAVLV
jgi:hypothetical protein